MQKAVTHVNTVLAEAVKGHNGLDQCHIDSIMIKEDLSLIHILQPQHSQHDGGKASVHIGKVGEVVDIN